MARKTILDNLVADNLLSLEKSQEIIRQSGNDEAQLEDLVIAAGVSETGLLKAKSSFFGIPAYELGGNKIPFDILKNISEESANHYRFVPLEIQDGTLVVGMVSPEDIESREALKFISTSLNLPFKINVITQSDFNTVMTQYKGIGGEVGKALGELESQLGDDAVIIQNQTQHKESVHTFVEDTPVTKIVAVILKHATEGKASDIHIEPGLDRLRVRFRLDGVLYTSLFLPLSVHDAIVARIKILTNLLLDEKRKPQDGRFSARIEGRDIDFRVSTFPTSAGEKVVIRILDSSGSVKSLEALGVEGRNLKLLQDALKRPYGMILVTGPTGSGKSTTLYAILQILNEERSNVISLEDPVEYNIAGVNQSQVHPEIGYDFAAALRSVLRQDPDIIMVGEIRDKETAQLAIHAALTGHLVLSTLHTNDATGVIPRLIDMGVDPFLIPSTLILAIGQRLVRTLCAESKKALKLEGNIKAMIEKEMSGFPQAVLDTLPNPNEIYQALPSASCPKGTRGRLGVFEMLAMTPEMENIILHEPTDLKIIEEAKRQGMITMRQDGLIKVLKGQVGLEELSEVAVIG